MCWGAESDVPHTLLRQAGLHKHTVGDTGVQKLFKKIMSNSLFEKNLL